MSASESNECISEWILVVGSDGVNESNGALRALVCPPSNTSQGIC